MRTSILLALLIAAPVHAQDLSDVLDGLELREIGPAIMGGRISDLAVNESNPAHFFVGTATGGVWETRNNGQSWTPIFDDQPTSSIGALALAPSNPNVLWVGTGEPQNRQSSPWGAGVFKSMDGGRTWRQMGLVETRHVGAVVIHPRDPDVVYVAALGHLWGPNPERGVFKTTDGGETWDRVLYVDENTGAVDLVMDPGDPNTLFAAMYQRRRTGFGFSASGGGSGLYRTLDGGATWEELTEGLPRGDKGRIGLDIYRRNGNLVYATVESDERGRGLYRSRDRGETWERVSRTNPRPMYFSLIRIDPNDPERIYVGGVRLSASDDGGKTFGRGDAAQGVHVDHHAFWIDPSNSNHLLMGSDGGLATSWDRSETWAQIDNLPIGQFYEIGLDMSDPYRVCGGLQDNSSWCAPHDTRSEYGIRNGDWVDVSGGDGFYNVIDPTNPDIIYAESQGGNLSRYDGRTGESARIRPVARPTDEDEDREYRFNWNTPVVVSSHDPATVYIGANHLLRTRDRGLTWQEASPDLTKQIDRDTLTIMGARVTDETLSGNDGIGSYGTITAIAESPSTPDVLFVGTDDGNVQRTRDAGVTWTDLSDRFPGLPARTYVSSLQVSTVEGRVYVTFDGHRNDDYAPHVYVSDDGGESWRSIDRGLPEWSVNRLKEHPQTPSLLFVGNEIGLFVSGDRGETWHRLTANLPTVPVDDIEIHPRDNDLVLGTHGRSIWILDDLGVLEAMAGPPSVLAEAPVRIFPVRSVRIENNAGSWPFWGDEFQGQNPPDGAILRVWIGEGATERVSTDGPAGRGAGNRGTTGFDGDSRPPARSGAQAADAGGASVQLTISDSEGREVRTLEVPAGSGVHQLVWDLRLDPPYQSDGEDDEDRRGGRPQGPLVLPGTYQATLALGAASSTAPIVVEEDSRIAISDADRRARQEALMDLHALAKPVHEAQERLGEARDRLEELTKTLTSDAGASAALSQAADSIESELDDIEDDLDDASPGRMRSGIEGSTSRPTEDQLYQIDRSWETVPSAIERLNALVGERIPALRERLVDEGLAVDETAPLEVPTRPGR